MKPFFSIIIPTYNSERVLSIALKSITSQSFLDYEILIIDGFSADNTLEIAQDFHDERIKIFSEKDNGIYDAMNKGIKYAKGEWLYFLGSDDTLYNEDILAEIQKKIQNNSNTKILYGNVKLNGDSGWAKHGQVYDGYFKKSKIITNNICHQAIFYHKDVFKTLGNYNLNYKICADHDFNIRAASLFKFYYINIIVAKFTGGGMSSGTDELFVKNYDKIVIKFHSKILYRIKINNQVLLDEAIVTYQNGKILLFIYLTILYLYKITFQKLILKIKYYL